MKIMKTCVTMLFFCVLCMANTVTSFSQEKTISLKAKDYTLKELCSEIEKNSDYRFVFSGDVSKKMNNPLHFDNANGTVEEILQTLSGKAAVNYNIYGKQIVLFDAPKEKVITPVEQTPPPAKKEFVTLKGKVVDEGGETLPGVSVYIPSSTIGVVTDIDGNFELQLPADESMIVCFDYVGMEHYEYVFEGVSTTIDVTMKDDNQLLKEVVVIGYGSKDRKSLTSSVSSMKSEQVERLATTTTSVDNLLGGNIKGVFSSQESGQPGAAIKIQVRGMTSLPGFGKNRSNSPLYVIDGMPTFVDNNALNPLLGISPSDIESIDVLKDAAATAIYGSRGANGVIIVKTKTGRKGEKVNVEAGYTFSMGNPIKEYIPLSTSEFKTLQDTKFKTALHYYLQNQGEKGISKAEFDRSFNILGNFETAFNDETETYTLKKYLGLKNDAFGTANTNWQREIRNKNAATHQYNVSVRGGSEFSNYSLSLNATDQEGLFINDRMKRYGSRLSVDSEIIPGVQAGGVLSFSYAQRKGAEPGETTLDPVWKARPDAAVYDKNGDLMRYDASGMFNGGKTWAANPVAQRQMKSVAESYQFSGNTYISAQLAKGLSVRADINVSSNLFDNSFFTPSVSLDLTEGSDISTFVSASKRLSRSTYTSVNVRADYTTQIGSHNLAAMLGAGADRMFDENVISIRATGFSNEDVLYNLASARQFETPQDGKINSGLNSLYSRFSYDYDSRYLAELSLRTDASSKFGPKNRVGFFPALSLGWRINNEAFMKDNDKVDDLKLRLSLGRTGSTNVEDFSYLQYFKKTFNYGEELAFTLENRLPNQQIRWETTSEANAGIDFSFFGSRLRGSLDVYRRFTKGSLVDAPFLLESGMDTFTANLLDLSNRGFEFEIGGDVVHTKDFIWSTSFNIAANRNRVEKINGADINSTMLDYVMEGQPMGIVKGYKVVKILQKEDLANLKKLNAIAVEKGGKNPQTGENNLEAYQAVDTGEGDYLYADINGDGMLTKEADRVVVANPEPKFFGGWSNTFSYKGLSLSFMMQFTQGGQAVYGVIGTALYGPSGASETRDTFGRTWTPENRDALYPRAVIGRTSYYNSMINNRFVFSTSYLRMKNITLSYDLNDDLLDALRLQNASLFTSVTNPFTLTRWPGIDPELIDMGNIYGGANPESPYPFSKTFSVGARITF